MLFSLLQTMRPKQWTKNILFIYPGLLFDVQLFSIEPFLRVTFACFLLCMISGTIYIINDLADVEGDRKHPEKRFRPIASGKLPIPVAKAAAIIIPTITLGIALVFDVQLAVILIIYLLLHIAYSLYLKRIVLIDILTVTAGFVLRVTAGVAVIEVSNFSAWLYACAALLALFLIVGKRRQELIALSDSAANVRPVFKEYNQPLLDDLLRIVTTSLLIAYILYTIEAPTGKVAGVSLGLLTVPIVMYGLFRYLYLIHVRGEGSAPDEVLLKDRPLQIAVLLWGVSFIFILYFVPRVL